MREMKNSGIDWIGFIPSDWKVERNKNCFTCSKKIVGDNWKKTQLLSLTTKGIKEKSYDDITGKVPDDFGTYQVVETGDNVMCLFDLDVSAVFSGISRFNGMISPAYKVLKAKSIMNSKFADYWFSFVFVDRKFKTYSKNIRYTLNYDEFAILPILLPSYEEQIRIANFLDKKVAAIDNVIAKTKESIEEYKKLKQSIITKAVTKGLNLDVEMKDSGIEWIGKIPENWHIQKIKNLGTCRNGLTYSPENQCGEEGILVLRSSNIQNGKLSFEDCVYVDKIIPDALMVKEGDILICSRNGSAKLIGKNAIVPNGLVASFGAFMMIYRCDEPKYMQYILSSNIFNYYLGTFLTVSVNQLTGNAFENMQFPYTNDKFERQRIVDYLDKQCSNYNSLIERKERTIDELERYKKSLIYEYVTGKKEVPND